MFVDFDKIFHPSQEEKAEQLKHIKQIYEEHSKNKGCTTCKHCKKVVSYPGFVTAEEYFCNAGLKCDTVLFTVKNCPNYKMQTLEEWSE